MSPTQRTLKHLRAEGWTAAIAEHWNSFARKRFDLFGFGDILAFNADLVALIQTTSGSNHSARRNKIVELPEARAWLMQKNRAIFIISWTKKAKTKRWTPRIEHITIDMFP